MSRKAGAIPEETRARLIESATLEFAERGFEKASLRRICSNANVTTGALYFFFADKDDLFASVLSPVTDRILALLKTHYEAELAIPPEYLKTDESEDFRAADQLLELYFSNRIACDLLLNNREHPTAVSLFDRLTELIDHQTLMLLKRIHPILPNTHMFNECTIHWLSHLQIDTFTHILSHGFGQDRAKEQLKIMVRFLRGGFLALLPKIEK